jgi:hypothetical protein
MIKLKMYEFNVRVIGSGNTPEEAWDNLLDDGTFKFDDGDYSIPSPEDIKLIDDDGESEEE